MMKRSLLTLVATLSICVFGSSTAWTADASTRTADAIRRCNNQMGCMVIHEKNGDVVIFQDDVDGDGKGGGVIRCPANTGNCNPMRETASAKRLNRYFGEVEVVTPIKH